MKKETLEEAAEKWLNKDGFNIYNHYDTRPSFIAGGKWQQQQMYSVIDKYVDDVMLGCNLRFDKWFELNKSK